MNQVNQAEKRQMPVRGGQLPVWVRDGEGPALVFLHYWGGSHRTFERVISRLDPGRAVVSYDHRGWSAARELPGPYGIGQLADDALDVAAGLGLSRYVLAGHSMGGKAAQLAASRRPEGLTGLALIAPAPPRPAVDAAAADALSHAYDSRATVSGALERVLTRRPLPEALREQVISDSLASDEDACLAWPRHGITADITSAVGAIEVPVLILAGEHDQVDPPASLEANLLPFIPGARMTVIQGAGHLSPLEASGQLADELARFAVGLSAASNPVSP